MTTPRRGRNARLEAAGLKLAGHVAVNVTSAVAALRARIDAADGYPGSGDGGGRVAGGDSDSTTARTADRRYALGVELEDLRDAVTAVCAQIDHLDAEAARILRWAAPGADTVAYRSCSDGQEAIRTRNGDRAGVWSWGEPCQHEAVKAGLCVRHYTRWYRWRQEQHIDTRSDFVA